MIELPRTRRAPSPHWGEGWGEGTRIDQGVRTPSPGSLRSPTSPHGRGGGRCPVVRSSHILRSLDQTDHQQMPASQHQSPKSDIEISRAARLRPITEIASQARD